MAHPLDAPALVAALDATWAIVERSLATWSPAMLEEVISRPEWPDRRTHPRGWVLSRVATHDAWHASEVNETLTATANAWTPGAAFTYQWQRSSDSGTTWTNRNAKSPMPITTSPIR